MTQACHSQKLGQRMYVHMTSLILHARIQFECLAYLLAPQP